MAGFGKKRKKKRSVLNHSLKRQAKNLGIRLMVKRNGKRVYKTATVLRKQIQRKKKGRRRKRPYRRSGYGYNPLKQYCTSRSEGLVEPCGQCELCIEQGYAASPLIYQYCNACQKKTTKELEQARRLTGIKVPGGYLEERAKADLIAHTRARNMLKRLEAASTPQAIGGAGTRTFAPQKWATSKIAQAQALQNEKIERLKQEAIERRSKPKKGFFKRLFR